MGLFSSSSETVVSSVVYNMAGEEDARNNFLQTTVVGSVLKDGQNSIADDIVSAHLNGPGIKQRNLFRWASLNYDYGMPDFEISTINRVSPRTVAQYVPTPAGTTVRVTNTFVADGNIDYWAERYLLRDRRDRLSEPWTADYLKPTDEIRIQYVSYPTEVIDRTYPRFSKTARYVYAYYMRVYDDGVTPEAGPFLWIYPVGGEHEELNDIRTVRGGNLKEFYPFIPVRFNNRDVNSAYYAGTVHGEKPAQAYRKATGDSIDELIATINENPDEDEIDYIWMVYGVSLNVIDQKARKYLYNFFTYMMQESMWSMQDYEAWKLTNRSLDPVATTIRLKSNHIANYDQRISWVAIDESFHSGRWRDGARVGRYVFTKGGIETWNGKRSETIFLYHQIEPDRYRRLRIVGLQFQNHVYDDEFVEITAHEALDDGEESGFIIPMHYPTLSKMSLVDATQLTTANTFLVFNCYTVVKKRWWQRGFFQILLVIAIAVISVYFAPAGAVTGGILGTNVAVGSALGLSGTAAILAGAAVNALAGLVLARVISAGAVALFGEKWGAVIGAIVTFVMMSGLTYQATQGALGMQWGSMMRMDNLMKLTNVLGDAYAGWMRGDIAEMYGEGEEAREAYEKRQREIRGLEDELGLNDAGVIIDPNWFMGIQGEQSNLTETPNQFISRTTMVGSDMIDLSLSMIYDFVEMTTTLPKIGD